MYPIIGSARKLCANVDESGFDCYLFHSFYSNKRLGNRQFWLYFNKKSAPQGAFLMAARERLGLLHRVKQTPCLRVAERRGVGAMVVAVVGGKGG